MNTVMNQQVDPRPCEQLSASQGHHAVTQLRRISSGPDDTRFLGHGQVWPPWQLQAVSQVCILPRTCPVGLGGAGRDGTG